MDELKDEQDVLMYYYELGVPNGIPLVYLHGGPGDEVNETFKAQFDEKKYRIILFDQRGCGKSTPRNHLEKNTTPHLLQDIEKLRSFLKVEKWVVAGGSWGSSLALIYAEKHPSKVLGLLLRGVFDLSLENCVLESVYPESDEQIKRLLGTKTKVNARSTRVLNGRKSATRRKLIQEMGRNEPLYVIGKPPTDPFKVQETLALLGNHYEVNRFFTPKNYIYKNIWKIKHIPTIIVQGRYDVVTPMNMAYKISKLLPRSDLRVFNAGHTMKEKAILNGLREASTDLAQRIKPFAT